MVQNNNCLNKNKDWNIGAFINIGFMKGLEIIDIVHDTYILKNKFNQKYQFIPYKGIHSI